MVPDITGVGHSFKGAMAYYLHDKAQAGQAHPQTSERVAWSEVRNMIDVGAHTATRIMIATASQADELKAAAGVKNTGRKSNAHVYAYSLAWHPDEAAQLDRTEMVRAADQSLKALGAQEHQAVIVCHVDQKHPHVHVIVNRVHPETGKMLATSNDRLKLSDWANQYERERGQILTPRREEKRIYAQDFEKAARKAFVDERRQQAGGPDRSAQDPQRQKKPSEAAILKELSDAQKARHKSEWPQLSERAATARNAIYSDYGQRIKDAAAAHKAAVRSVWRDHFRAERQETRRFEQNERSLTGIVRNALDAAKHQQATGQAPERGTLSLTFLNVLSASARAIALAERQQAGRTELGRELKGILDREISMLKEQRGAALQGQRESFAKERAALIETQNAERAKMREAWRQVYERRGKDPRYQARQQAAPAQEQKPMRKDFEKTRLPAPSRVVVVERSIATPAPAPSPAGVPAAPVQARQSVPQVDRAAEWAKTPAGRETLARNAPVPPVRKNFDRSAEAAKPAPAPAPQTRAEKWNARAKEIGTERKTIERDRSRDRDFDRDR